MWIIFIGSAEMPLRLGSFFFKDIGNFYLFIAKIIGVLPRSLLVLIPQIILAHQVGMIKIHTKNLLWMYCMITNSPGNEGIFLCSTL